MPNILDDENHQDLVPGLGVGQWIPFEADPGWNSTLRYRRIPIGLQLEGAARGPLPANALGRIGVLPPGARPARQQYCPIVITVGISGVGWGYIRIDTDGQLFTWWSIAGTATDGAAINAIFPTD